MRPGWNICGQQLWIDGKLVSRFATGTMRGAWFKDNFRIDPVGGPFEGICWRTDERVKVNRLWLSHYVTTDSAFPRTDKYAAAHPEFKVNLKEQTVSFANLVTAMEYVGPLGEKK